MSVLDGTYGCTLIMVFVASMLYGVGTLQTYIYSQTYMKDPLFLKLMVAAVWILETAHIAFCILFTYVYLINHFGDLEYLQTHVHWSAGITLLCSLVLTLIVHSFYVFRIWIITNGSIPLTSFVVFFAVTRFGGNLATICVSFIFHDWIAFQTHKISTVLIFIGSGSGAIVDILVAGIMVYHIRKGKSGLTQSDNMVNRIVVYTINTGALTCITSSLIPIMFAADGHSFAFLGEIQSKLYSNAFLATLNARQYIRNKFSNNPVAHTHTSIHFANRLAQATVTAPEAPVPLVNMMGSDESSTTVLSTQKSGPNDLKVEPIM
ncbi:hypothetical protein NM688_g3172 [Phlebia brevispora]|uniref:Uncharacterized protein n=1 Tax=Phlebia brevispora TaxID=194682 RepID=A0ACC1T6Q7_9APHY|nr:hypothetical protein NM688_g3172 [Phlebia brevispora]